MKINGKALGGVNVKDVVMFRNGEEVVIKVAAQRNNYLRRFRDDLGLLELPEPRKDVQKVKGVIQRDEQGAPVLYPVKDAAYRKKEREVYDRVFILQVLEALRLAGLELSATQPGLDAGKSEWESYLSLASEELLGEDGFTRDELNRLIEISDKLGATFNVEEAIEAF